MDKKMERAVMKEGRVIGGRYVIEDMPILDGLDDDIFVTYPIPVGDMEAAQRMLAKVDEEISSHLVKAMRNFRYHIDGYGPFTFTQYLKLMKGKYGAFGRYRANESARVLPHFLSIVEGIWDDVVPYRSIAEIVTDYREHVDQIAVAVAYSDPALLSSTAALVSSEDYNYVNHWLNIATMKYEDRMMRQTISLYKVDASTITPRPTTGGAAMRRARIEGQIALVKVTCPSTNRDYFLTVNSSYLGGQNPSAGAALMSLCPCPISNPEKIYRHGNVVAYKMSKDSVMLDNPVLLHIDTFLRLAYSQT